jgi:hypothetical protein
VTPALKDANFWQRLVVDGTSKEPVGFNHAVGGCGCGLSLSSRGRGSSSREAETRVSDRDGGRKGNESTGDEGSEEANSVHVYLGLDYEKCLKLVEIGSIRVTRILRRVLGFQKIGASKRVKSWEKR